MKPAKKKNATKKATTKAAKATAAAALLRIGGHDIELVQFMDYLDTQVPGGQRVVILNFEKARLSDANDSQIHLGPTIVRLRVPFSTAAAAMITRLLQPFKGYFVINVMGTYVTPGPYAEVFADEIAAVNIQPINTPARGKRKSRMVEVP